MPSKQLAQARPVTTATQFLYSPAGTGNVRTTGLQMVIVNDDATVQATYRIFHDDDGSTYDESTALYWDKALPVMTRHVINLGPMNNAAGSIGIRGTFNTGLTFTLWGTEIP